MENAILQKLVVEKVCKIIIIINGSANWYTFLSLYFSLITYWQASLGKWKHFILLTIGFLTCKTRSVFFFITGHVQWTRNLRKALSLVPCTYYTWCILDIIINKIVLLKFHTYLWPNHLWSCSKAMGGSSTQKLIASWLTWAPVSLYITHQHFLSATKHSAKPNLLFLKLL